MKHATDTMTCAFGHTWERPRVRGARPTLCPNHSATKDRDQRIAKLYASGASAPVLASQFSIGTHWVYRIIATYGVECRGRKPPLTGRCKGQRGCTRPLVGHNMCHTHLKRVQRGQQANVKTYTCNYGHTWQERWKDGKRAPRIMVCPEHRAVERAAKKAEIAARTKVREARRDQVVRLYQTARSAFQVAKTLELNPNTVYSDLRSRGYEVYRELTCAFDGHAWIPSGSGSPYYCPEHRDPSQPGDRQIVGQHLDGVGVERRSR